MIRKYLINLFIACSQLINTILCGDPDETLCSRVAKSRARGGKWGAWIIRPIEWLDPQPNHFDRALNEDADEGKRQIA